ncbi:GNAT family N-acetyltransferase [Hymenobacter weizhouensis]|uniref:GNAT family N-acetyltransferase n=1 Tax=Hymenobacter sp. YIM 151500-1 TaxID=2987689 RepID=UPI0022273F07|nr:GNAT family N-acetyltransferase [Hymenobacter sp. YIM 151500-1]UYZ62930.1 GNAT family N-acetyltransferase [Hymenobacter sp. YIM 151500-1]
MLTSDFICLRPLEDDDLEFLYALENDPSVWGVSDTLAPVSRHVLRQYLDSAAADFFEVRQLRLVIEETRTRQALGTLDIFGFEPLHQRAGIGITVLASHRRRGVARAALGLVVPYARQVLRLHQLHCTIGADNRASLRLFRAAGFWRVGVRREWLRTESGWQDAVEMQLLLAR